MRRFDRYTKVRALFLMAALTPPKVFPFKAGVTPYPIQTEFMEKMFTVMERGGLGILESPTGTVRRAWGGAPPRPTTVLTARGRGRRASRSASSAAP